MAWIETLMSDYYHFLKENTIIHDDTKTDWVEISTPFIGLFNDTVDIYIKKKGNQIFLSDDGNTLRNLKLSGVDVSRAGNRKDLLNRIMLNYGTTIQNDELTAIATERDFAQKKHNLISAILEASDMYQVGSSTIASVFKDDVKKYLSEVGLIYTPHFISKGNAGLDFTFDFQIAGANTEIVIESFTRIDNNSIASFLFTWEDIKKVREQLTGKSIKSVAIINDTDKDINPSYIDALQKYDAHHILWSEREKPDNIEKLKAA